MNTDEHRYSRDTIGKELLAVVRNLCLSVFICGSKLWQFLRAVLDDDAYDRYLAHHPGVIPSASEGSAFLSPAEFYLARLRHKYSRPTRCC